MMNVSTESEKMIKYIDHGLDYVQKPVYRLDSVPSATFTTTNRLTEDDFSVGPETFKKLEKWNADGPQEDPVIGSQSYF
jgi:hypothetical protein